MALEGYHSPQVDVAVRLNTNESPEPPPEAFRRRVAEAVAAVDWHRYPDRGARALRAALAAHHGVAPANVFCANGSNEVLQTVLLTYGGPGRVAMVFEPTYRLHAHIARITGTGVVTVDRTRDLTIDPAAAADAITRRRPAVVLVCSPNNPTGIAEAPGVVTRVCEAAGEAGALVVVDEAYGQFARWSALRLVDGERPVAVTRTYSKTWAMAAARLGYLVGPTWLVERLEQVVLPYHLDAVTQIAGVLALDHEAEMRERVGRLVAERERLVAALGSLDVDLWPSEANFVLFRPRRVPAADVWRGLVDRGVLIRDTSGWPGLEGTLRVTVGSPGENDRFLEALTEVIAAGG